MPREFAPPEHHLPLRRDQPHDRLAGRGTPDAIAPQQGYDLAFVHIQVDAVQDVALPIIGVQIADLQHHPSSAPR